MAAIGTVTYPLGLQQPDGSWLVIGECNFPLDVTVDKEGVGRVLVREPDFLTLSSNGL